MLLNKLILKAGAILELSPAQRSVVIPCILIFVNTQYILLDLLFIFFPSPYINMTAPSMFIMLHVLFLVISVTMILMRHRLNSSDIAQKIVPYVYTQFYVFSLMFLGYIIGITSIVTGIVIAATPLICMLLFSDGVTVAMIVSGVSSYALIATLQIIGIAPNAPFFLTSANPDTHEKLFYALVMISVSAPYLVAFMLGAYLLVRYWQSREDGVRRAGLTDSLTNMANRRAIHDNLEELVNHHNAKMPISVILVDIDYFKSVNDTYGHATGDLVLRRVSDSLKASLRGDDEVGRFGGEEFLINLPNTSLEIAEQIAERCRVQIEQTIILNLDHKPIRVTASFGVYCSTNPDEDLTRILHAADVQLYRAKESGRNRVCAQSDLLLA